MTVWIYRWMHLANLAVGITGLVYAWMRYLVQPDPETFSVVNHPWQPHVQHAHVLAAPFLVFAVGAFWWGHGLAYRARGVREGRRSGTALLGLAFPMIVSGYALQVSVSGVWRSVWIVLHVATSLAWLAAFAGHWIRHRLVAAGGSTPP